MKGLLAAVAGALGMGVLLAVVALSMLSAVPGLDAGAQAPMAGPGPAADGDIPPNMLALYVRSTARCPGLAWEVLAAIGKVETDHGRGDQVSSAGAEGPMQFMPDTWAAYAVDGDGDGVASVWDAADAVPAAADYLCANGGGDPQQLPAAIFAYNHDDQYVALVLSWAARYVPNQTLA